MTVVSDRMIAGLGRETVCLSRQAFAQRRMSEPANTSRHTQHAARIT